MGEVEGAQSGVRVNGIAPDSIETPMMRALVERLGGGEDALLRLAGMTPLGRAEHRLGRAQEVAALVTFLLGPEAAWITGAIVPVDGGILAADVHHLPPPDELRSALPLSASTTRREGVTLRPPDVLTPDGGGVLAHRDGGDRGCRVELGSQPVPRFGGVDIGHHR
jgi:hypothetical protein